MKHPFNTSGAPRPTLPAEMETKKQLDYERNLRQVEFEKRISAEQELEELKGRRKERLAKRSKERRQRQKRRRTDLAQEVKDKDEIILEKDTLIRQLYALIDEKNAEIERLQSNAKPQPTQQTQQSYFILLFHRHRHKLSQTNLVPFS